MPAKILNLVKTEPALLAGVVQAVLALLAGTVLPLTAAEAGAVLALTTAVLALTAAAATSPFQVASLTGFVSALVTLLVAFGVPHVEPSLVSLVNAFVTALAAVLVRTNVTPVATLKKLASQVTTLTASAGQVQVAAAVLDRRTPTAPTPVFPAAADPS